MSKKGKDAPRWNVFSRRWPGIKFFQPLSFEKTILRRRRRTRQVKMLMAHHDGSVVLFIGFFFRGAAIDVKKKEVGVSGK